ncbi:hypothetical protein BKA56DRAFT_585703 [Ilyonectria sp. MPI-CAGE-AT-0026]|nr:hypothetical protein BKA56DRAFT_585703 [Ilyonectria sp. MPI-CAGE-AT-0026]
MATAQRIPDPTFDDLPWYRWWVLQQLGFQPQRPLLQQVLLSYRLLFRQSKKSREVFRSLRPFARIPADGHGQFLSQLCGRKHPPDECAMEFMERDEYDLIDDFPHLRSRLVRLSSYASSKRPQSILQL